VIQRFFAWLASSPSRNDAVTVNAAEKQAVRTLSEDGSRAFCSDKEQSPRESGLPGSGISIDDAVDQVFESVEAMVLERIQGVNKLTESEILSVGDALQRIVKEAQAHVEATRGTLSAIAGDRSDESVTGLVSRQASRSEHFLSRVEALIAQQSRHAEHAVVLTKRIAELGDRVSNIAFQSRLLSLNASVEAARLSGQGAAFGVISVEMKRLSDAVEDANRGVADLASELTEALPNIAKVGNELLQCSNSFRQELNGGLQDIKDATSSLRSTIGDSMSDGDKRIDRVIHESNAALSHLQFQDVCAQSLLIIDKDLDNTRLCIKNVVAGAGVAAKRVPDDMSLTVERASSNRDRAGGEVMVLNGGMEASDAGEVLLF
jgi:hypothetical protein